MRLMTAMLCTLLVSPTVLAGDAETLFNRVHLDAQAEREVSNDEVIFRFVASAQGNSPRELAQRVNTDMAWALKQAQGSGAVKAGTESYFTRPVYDKGVIQSWEVRQELRLVGSDMAAASEMAGVLQERLQLEGMEFRPTTALRERTEDELIDEAMRAFHRRAALVGRQMDGREYRVVELHVATQGQPRPIAYAERGMAMAKAAPAMEAGTSTVQVTVSGSVQFY